MALTKVEFPPHIEIDEVFFLSLLRSCLSLSASDKARVLNSMNHLSQFQVDELVLVFLDERKQFVKLADNDKEKTCIQSLLDRTLDQWNVIEQKFDIPQLLTEQQVLKEADIFLEQYNYRKNFNQALSQWLMSDYQDDENDEEDVSKAEVADDHIDIDDIDKDDNIDIEDHIDFDDDIDTDDIDRDDHIDFDDDIDTDHIDIDDDIDFDDDIDIDDDLKKMEKVNNLTKSLTNLDNAKDFSLLGKMSRDQDFDKQLFNKPTVPSPLEVYRKLQHIIFDQDIALKRMTVILFYHYQSYLIWETEYRNNSEMNSPWYEPKEPVCLRQPPTLLIGKTGTGKTHLIKNAVQCFNLNFVVVNSSTLVRTGIVGTSIDTIGRMIFESAGKDIGKAEFSVVFLDEFDKLFVHAQGYEANTNLSIALQLLMIMEGSAPFPVEHSSQQERDGYPTHIDSSKMLFILGGSFGIHEKNLSKIAMGFHPTASQKALQDFNQVYLSDLGLPDELSGRIGQVICLNPINKQSLKDILLNSPNSPWKVLENQIHLMNCQVILPDEVIEHLIHQHQKDIEKFGVRGLYQAFNRLPCIYDFLLEATLQSGQTFYICLPE